MGPLFARHLLQALTLYYLSMARDGLPYRDGSALDDQGAYLQLEVSPQGQLQAVGGPGVGLVALMARSE